MTILILWLLVYDAFDHFLSGHRYWTVFAWDFYTLDICIGHTAFVLYNKDIFVQSMLVYQE